MSMNISSKFELKIPVSEPKPFKVANTFIKRRMLIHPESFEFLTLQKTNEFYIYTIKVKDVE
jgi:hypothetical protein